MPYDPQGEHRQPHTDAQSSASNDPDAQAGTAVHADAEQVRRILASYLDGVSYSTYLTHQTPT